MLKNNQRERMRTMITKKRWTPEEDAIFMDMYNDITELYPNLTPDDVFRKMEESHQFNGKRTFDALKRHYYVLKENEKPKQTNEYSDFLLSLELMRNTYESTLLENQQLKKRIAELEEAHKEFEVLARVMDKARKMVVTEELGEHEKPRFKMDGNGNLERV